MIKIRKLFVRPAAGTRLAIEESETYHPSSFTRRFVMRTREMFKGMTLLIVSFLWGYAFMGHIGSLFI